MAQSTFILKVKEVGKIQQITDKFRKLEITGYEVRSDNRDNILKIQAVNDKADQLEKLLPDTIMSVNVEINGREWNGKDGVIIFQNLDIFAYTITQSPRAKEEAKSFKSDSDSYKSIKAKDVDSSGLFPDPDERSLPDLNPNDDEDDLPF